MYGILFQLVQNCDYLTLFKQDAQTVCLKLPKTTATVPPLRTWINISCFWWKLHRHTVHKTTQNYMQTFNTLSRGLIRVADSSSTIPALGGTNIKTRDKPGTTLKKTTKSSLLFIYSNNLQQDTMTHYLSLISVFILRANCVVFPVLYQCFHRVPNKKGTISANPKFLGINALYIGTAILNLHRISASST